MPSFFIRLWKSLFGNRSRSGSSYTASPRRMRNRPPTARKPRPDAAPHADPKDAAAESILASVGVRRPLLAASGAIAGFEFRISQQTELKLQQQATPRLQGAHVAALLVTAHLMAETGRIGFARVPAHWLVHATGLNSAKGAWVGIEAPHDPTLDLAQLRVAVLRLRASGAKVGWDVTSVFGLVPDFLLLNQGAAPMEALLRAIGTWPLTLRNLPTVVTDIACVEDLEQALYSGISYACGALVPTGKEQVQQEPLPVPPEVQRVGFLLNQLVTGAETDEIVQAIKSDVGLSYRLLCRIHSAAFAQVEAGASIEQAVMLLGRNELYRWLSLLLVQFAGHRKVSSAWQEIALWRSRLLELLAIERQDPASDQLFTLGLASMLSPLLKISVADVVSTLHLPEPAAQALLAHSGPWYSYLHLAQRIEAQDLGDSNALADPFGGVTRVLALADEAWAWAKEAEHANSNEAHDGEAATPASVH